jgi:hypothetical protein
MKNLTIIFLLFAFSFTVAQQDSTITVAQPQAQKSHKPSKIYYGGAVGLNLFGDYFRISVEPLVGYKITPELSGGAKLMYEYVKDSRYSTDVTSNNYGGYIFARYRIIPAIFFHAEYAYYSYQYRTESFEGDRNWVPFLLLGGGYTQRVGGNTCIFAQALWDVIQDEKSPYVASEPWISVGVSVGF